jgi:hypothetical protein
LKQEVLNDYDLNKYINNEKPKQLIKWLFQNKKVLQWR